MNVIGVLGKARKLLGKLTDFLIKGRQAGLWEEKPAVTRFKARKGRTSERPTFSIDPEDK